MKDNKLQATNQLPQEAIKTAQHPLQRMVDEATEERKIMSTYIKQHMVAGVDYAPIHIKKDCPNKYNCAIKSHWSKDNLTKAGAEKIKDLLKLYPDFKRDEDTWQMAGSKAGLFCYRCILLTADQKPAGVGLGACDVSEKYGNMNNAIKIAKKRAFVDAILTTGSLSDFFTQDLDDMPSDEPMTPRQMADAKEQKTYKDEDGIVHEPVQSKPAQTATPEHYCSIHKKQMKERKANNGDIWYDHRWQDDKDVWQRCYGDVKNVKQAFEKKEETQEFTDEQLANDAEDFGL